MIDSILAIFDELTQEDGSHGFELIGVTMVSVESRGRVVLCSRDPVAFVGYGDYWRNSSTRCKVELRRKGLSVVDLHVGNLAESVKELCFLFFSKSQRQGSKDLVKRFFLETFPVYSQQCRFEDE